MIWLFLVLQAALIRVGWWVYWVYFTQPMHAHPPLFWNPMARFLLTYVPTTGIIGLVISAFYLTNHPWWFLIFTVFWLGYTGHKYNRGSQVHDMPVLTEGGLQTESLTTEELLEDIRRHNLEARKSQDEPLAEDAMAGNGKISGFLPSKEWLMDKIPYQDIASGVIYEKKESPRYWMLPTCATDSERWIKFQQNIQPDDEVWTFSSTVTNVKSPLHWAGICLLRDGEINDFIVDELHLHYRK